VLQRSLFPDAFEVQEQALAALDALDLAAARRGLEEARVRDPELPELASWSACIGWLSRELGEGSVDDDGLAAAFARVPEEHQRGAIDGAAAQRIDAVIARLALARGGPPGAFLDGAKRVHRGALLLVANRAQEAIGLLRESLAEGCDGRADVWGYFADACHALERADEANAGYVRALLLGAGEADLHRLRHARLRSLLDELRARHPEEEARELLVVHAWLEGTLAVPPENGWLDRHLSRLRLANTARPGASAAERARRFALLLYLDRSRRPGDFDECAREELRALAPELFERVLGRMRLLERRLTRPLAW
jgi:hypothetical protein